MGRHLDQGAEEDGKNKSGQHPAIMLDPEEVRGKGDEQ